LSNIITGNVLNENLDESGKECSFFSSISCPNSSEGYVLTIEIQ